MADHRQNNFDFLRFVAALLVVWGHSYNLSGLKHVPNLWGKGIHSLGLVIFFCISGYLVTDSWLRSPYLGSFFWKRALRIFPGLAGCIIVSALVVGPLVTALPLFDYLSSPTFARYFENIALHIRFRLPGVFDNNPLTAVNGSLWSLPIEFACYITLAIAAVSFGKRLPIVVLFIAGITAIVSIFLHSRMFAPPPNIYNVNVEQMMGLFPYFFVGSAIFLFREHVELRVDIACGLAAMIFILTAVGYQPALMISLWLFAPYIFLTIGIRSTAPLNAWGAKRGDMSYGIYLYSFPIQQILVYFAGGSLHIAFVLIGSVIGSVACGWVSWRYLEKPALSLKSTQNDTRQAFS